MALTRIQLYPAQILGILRTKNIARVQSAIAADQIKLSRDDWFSIWVTRGEYVP